MAEKPDAYEWEIPDSWGNRPPPLCGHTLSVLDRTAYLIGGCGPMGGEPQVFDHVYALDLVTWKWSKLDPCLPHERIRVHSPQVQDMINVMKMLGLGGGKPQLSHTEAEPETADSLKARWKHSTCAVGPDHLLMFGGIGTDDNSTRLGDLWLLDLTEFSSTESSASRHPESANPLKKGEGGEEGISPMHQRSNSLVASSTESPQEGPDSFVDRDERRPIWIRPRTEVQGAPSPRSHTSLVFHKNKAWVFGGYGGDRQARMHLGDLVCLHAHDERASLWAQDELLQWSRPEVYGTPPKPRSGHNACTVESVMIVSGGRDHHGLLSDAHVFDFQSDTWSSLRDALTMQVQEVAALDSESSADADSDNEKPLAAKEPPRPHSARPHTKASTHSSFRLSTTRSGVSGMDETEEAELPLKVCNHVASALDSVPSFKFFMFGGQTCGKSEEEVSKWRYSSKILIMDCSTRLWINLDIGGSQQPGPREDSAWAYDPKSARLILYGGWSDEWLSDLYNLDVSSIVGPPYAVQSVEPANGPVTGNTLMTIRGLNFNLHGQCDVKVKFVSSQREEIVDAELISAFEISARSPSWEATGADEVDVRVSLAGEAFTVNKVKWGFYINTMPENCIAYGPGVISPCYWGIPAIFRIQARDSTGSNRTSGLDPFEVQVRRRVPEPEHPDDKYDADGKAIEFEHLESQIVDNGDGSYEVTYVPLVPDSEYIIDVLFEGTPIRGSPWSTTTIDPWTHSVKALALSHAPRDLDKVEHVLQGSKLVLFGGSSNTVSILDLNAFRWDAPAVLNPPKSQFGHSMLNLDHEKSMILHGNHTPIDGVEQGYCKDVHVVSGDKTGWRWTKAKLHAASDIPSLRTNAAACLLPGATRRVFVNGGLDHSGTLVDDSYILKSQNLDKIEWCKLKNVLSPEETAHNLLRSQQTMHDMTSTSAVFAMRVAQQQDHDKVLGLPGCRQKHQVFALDKDSVVMFGGVPFSSDLIMGQIIEKEGIVEWRTMAGAGKVRPRRDFGSYVHEGKIFIYGGTDQNGVNFDDIYMLDTRVEEDKWKWACLYASDYTWISRDRIRSLGVLNKEKLVLLLSAKAGSPCEEIHVLKYDELLESTTVNGKMAMQMVDELSTVQQFLKTERDILNQEIPSNVMDAQNGGKQDADEEELRSKIAWDIFGSLYRVEEHKNEVSLTLDILQEVLVVLRRQGSKLERLGVDLSECQDMWNEIQKLAPRITEKTQWLRTIETVKLREEISNIENKVQSYVISLKKRSSFVFVMNAESSFQDIAEVYEEFQAMTDDAETLGFEATVFGFPEQMEKSLAMLRNLGDSLKVVRQMWCFISLYESYVRSWGHVKWHELDCSAATEHFKSLLDLLLDLVSRNPAAKDWELYQELRVNMQNLLTTFEILFGMQQECIRDRHWDILKTLVDVRSLNYKDEHFMFQNLLAMDLHLHEKDIHDLLSRAQSEHEMENHLASIDITWSEAAFNYDHIEALNSVVLSLEPNLMDKLETHRVQISIMMNSKYLDAVLRTEPERGIVTFEVEVRHWESELSLVAEAVQLLEEVQDKWKNLSIFFLHKRDVPKALPEATEKFKFLDNKIRAFLTGLSKVKRVIAANHQDEVLTLQLEIFLEELEEGENALMSYAQKKRKTFPPFFFMSLAQVLATLGNEVSPELTEIDFKRVRSSISHVNVYPSGAASNAISWVSSEGSETVEFISEVVLDSGVIDNFKGILVEVENTLHALLGKAVEEVPVAADTSWFLEYPNQVALCALRIHFYSSMELELAKLAGGFGNKDAIAIFCKSLDSSRVDYLQPLISQQSLKSNKRMVLQNAFLLHIHLCDTADYFNQTDMTDGVDSFAWHFHIRVQWRLDLHDKANAFGELQGEQASGFSGIIQPNSSSSNPREIAYHDCVLQCGDRSYRYLHDYLGPVESSVITMPTSRAFCNALRAVTAYRGCLVLSEGNAGKTETIGELAALAGAHLEVVQCSPQTDAECMVNIFAGLASNRAWGCLRNFHVLQADVVAVCATFCKSVLLALAEYRTRCTFGHIEDIPLDSAMGFFVLWPSTINSLVNCPNTLHPSMKLQMRPLVISEPDMQVILRNWLMARGFKSADELGVKISHVAAFGRVVLKGLHQPVDWSLRVFKRITNLCYYYRTEGKWGESEEDELALFQREIILHFDALLDKDSRLIFHDFVADVFDKERVKVKQVNDQSSRAQKITDMLQETISSKLLCTDLAAEQMLDLENMLHFKHAVAITGATATGKTQLWQSLAGVFEARGVKTKWKQFNPKVFTSFELYGYMRGEIWKEGILPHLLKDLMGHVECRQLWFVIDCEVDPSWAENLQSLLGDTRLLSLANSENIRLSAQTKVILETKSLRHAAPSIVSRVSVLNTTHSLDWENWVQMWLETSEIVQTRHHCVKALIQQYVPPILNAIGNEMNSVVTVPAIKSVQTLCRLLDALVTNDNIPKNVEDESKIIEKYFAFAAIWAFGSGFTFENKRSFSVFWRQTFKSVRVPSKGTVFDYGIKRAEFISWQSLLEDEEKEAQIKMHSAPANPQHVSYETEEAKLATSKVFIHTTDTIAARTIGGLASAMHLNLLLIGASGTGKTALVEEMLRRLPNGYSKTRYQLTYLSGSHMIQGLFESVLEKKAGKNYGPIAAKNLAIVLDDINMEAVDQFRDQSGLELVRQMLDYKTWYDREKHAEKLLNGTQLIAGMNVARGNDAVNDRLLRHFVIFNQEYSQESLNRIFHARLKTYFEIPKFDPKLCDEAFINKLVLCTVDLHSKMNGLFQKSIETHHYDFDLRHQLRVLDGVRLADSFNFTEPHQLLSLWAHEAERVYRDTLVSQAAYVTFNKMLRDVCKRYFKDIEQKTIFAEPFIFTRLEQDDPNSTYTRILELERVTKQFEACIEKSHQDGNPQAKLFLFDVSIRNVLKIVRLLQMGHALVVSEGGNGKQSLTQLAAYFMHYTVWRLETSINYGIQDLRNEIRDMYMKVGLRDELIVLMITESAIVDEEFLVPFSEVLTTGDLRDAFTAEDKDAVHESLRNFAKDHGHVSDRDTCFQLFRARVMKTLRIALCLEPGPKLRQRMARFSSLQTCTQINWIHPWPVEVLQGVAETFLADVPLPLPSPPDDQSDQSEVDLKVVASSLAASYAIVIQMAADGDARRLQNVRVCLAPKMFLDHLKLFTALITKEGERMRTDMSNLELVMERIAEVNVSVELLEEELTKGAVSIDDAKLEEEALLQTIRNARVNVEEEQANVTAETNREEKLRDALSEQRAACNSILQEGEPAAKAARDAIVSIKARDLIEMKANPNSPHKYIEQVLFAMLALREIPAKNHDWATAKTMLKDVKSITEDTNKILAAISEGRVESRSISATRQYMDKEGFDPTEVRKKNPCAGALCESVMNVVRYYDIVSKSQSKLQLMGTTREEHDEAKQNLDKAKNGLKQFQTELENAEKACQVVSESKNKLLEQAKDLQKRRSLAQQLLMAVSVEQKLWADQMEQIRAMEPKLLGSALLSSSFVSYMGPMAPVFRKEFVKELLHLLSTNQVDCGKSPDPLRLICTRLMKLAWAQQGLPDDRTALENAAIVCTTTRTPLLIDPHLYFTRWICQKSSSGKVQHESAGSDSLKQKLTSAIECGWTLVVDGVENAVPLFLSRAVAKNIYQKGNSTLISLGDKEVECHPRFRLYLVTRASSPRIDSVVQAECTLIDCTTSMQGLEDVFLRVITQQRQPVIEVMRFETAREYADLELKLEERTVTVLAKLLAAQGSILLDPGLVQSLDGLATLRSDLTVKLNAREEKIEHASKMCQPYRNLAKSCVELYFIAQSLENIDPLYQFSLDAFTSALLNAAVKDIKRPARGFIHVPDFTKAGSDTNPFMRFRVMATLIKGGTKGHLDRGRVQLQASTEDANEGLAVKDSDSLMTSVSVKLCQFVQRGLFARDQLLFVVVVALRRMIKTGAVTRKELQSIIEFGQAAGGVLPDATRHASKVPVTLASFMSERNWQALCALEEVPGLQKLPHDVESSHDRWQRWICEATPEISTLPGVYGRTASPFQRLLILRAVRPDRVQQGFRSFVAENLGPDFVSDHSGETQLVEMYRISRPHMPLLLFSMSRTEETARRITTLIRKKKFGSKVVYLRHGKVSDDDVASDLKYAMKVGRWVVMFDAETRPQWLMLLDRLLQMRETQIDGEFRAFILYNSTTKRTNLEIPNSLVRSSICMTYEAPTSFQANVLKSLAVFDNERFLDRGSSPADQMKFENLVTELAICHASLVHRNSFLSLGWTREYDLSLEQLEEAGQIIVNSVTSSKTLQSSLISKIAETMYGDLVHDVRDMFLVQQSLHDMVQFKRDVNASKGRGDFLPGVRYKDDLTYGEYIKYFQEHDNLENANVLGLHHNASIQVALPKADAFLRYLAVVLEPSMPLDSGRKSVAAASDSLHELLEQLPINFVLDSIRDDVQNLGAMLEPLGYILLQEATRMNMVLDTIRPELRALQASLNGRTNISDHMERLLEAIMSNEVPASWLNVAHDALYGLSKWFIDLLSRVAFLETWKEGLKEGKAAPLSIWLPGLFNPRALMRCAKQMYLRANPSVASWEDLDVCGAVTVWPSESSLEMMADPDAIPTDGLLVHGLFLEGAAWEPSTQCIIDQVLQDVRPSVPVVYVKVVHVNERAPHVTFPIHNDPDQDPPYFFDCPVSTEALCTFVYANILEARAIGTRI